VEDSHFFMFYVLCLISCMHTLNFQTYLFIYICGFNFTLCTLIFYIDLIKLKFGPVENRCVYTDHLHIIFHATLHDESMSFGYVRISDHCWF